MVCLLGKTSPPEQNPDSWSLCFLLISFFYSANAFWRLLIEPTESASGF
jgi:hypothetical protein